jgi:hypothetical protein
MPRFLDQHPIAHASLTNEAVEAMRARIQAGTPDNFGVALLNAFVAANGVGYCLSEAPSAEAVVESHGALGYLIDTDNVVEVTTLV